MLIGDQTPLRVGLVGCGWHGKALAEAIVRLGTFRLVGCADPDELAASTAALLAPDANAYGSVEELLREAEVDAIVIATPHHLLAPVVLTALRAGKHVMVEKPIALNEREAGEIEVAAVKAGVCLMAGYSMRFSMGRPVRELLDAGAVGEIRAVTGAYCIGPMNDGWTASPELGGGPLLYIGCHLVDLALWFIGDEPVGVYADVKTRADTGTDDTSAFQVRFAKGALAQCLVTQAVSGFSYEIAVHGSAGRIILRGRNFLQFEIEVSSSVIATYGEPTAIRPAVRRDNITMMLVPELEEFAAAINEKRSPSITAADGRQVLRVLDAVMESGRSHQPVQLTDSRRTSWQAPAEMNHTGTIGPRRLPTRSP